MTAEFLDPGVEGNNDSGTLLPDAAKMLNRNARGYDRAHKMAAYSSGALGKMSLFCMGDSMMGYGSAPTMHGFIGAMRLFFYDPDIVFNNGSYFDNDTGEEFPGGPRGFNFAVGGTDTKHLLEVQMRHVRTAYAAGTLPDEAIISTFQNEHFYEADLQPETSCLRVIEAVDEILAMGRGVKLLGPWPHSQIGEGTALLSRKHYCEHRMKDWAATKAGVTFIPILDALKTGNPDEEANGFVNYKGWDITSGPGRASNFGDSIHASPYGQYLVAALVADAFRRTVRPFVFPVFEASPYDPVNNPWGNLFGAQGRLAGSGGFIVDVADPNPANWTRTASDDLPAGTELLYDHSKGVTIRPSRLADFKRSLRLTPSGMPTAYVPWALRFAAQHNVPNQTMHTLGEAWFVNADGWAGIGLGPAFEGAPGIPPGSIISMFETAGNYGEAGFVMPFIRNEHITFHSPAFPYQYGNRRMLMDLCGAFEQGIEPSGALDVGRVGMFKTTG